MGNQSNRRSDEGSAHPFCHIEFATERSLERPFDGMEIASAEDALYSVVALYGSDSSHLVVVTDFDTDRILKRIHCDTVIEAVDCFQEWVDRLNMLGYLDVGRGLDISKPLPPGEMPGKNQARMDARRWGSD